MQRATRAFAISGVAAVALSALCPAAQAADGESFLHAHKAEAGGVWMAVVVLVFVISGARYLYKPVMSRPALWVILRGLVAVLYTLPMIGALYGQWVFPREPGEVVPMPTLSEK